MADDTNVLAAARAEGDRDTLMMAVGRLVARLHRDDDDPDAGIEETLADIARIIRPNDLGAGAIAEAARAANETFQTIARAARR